MIVYRLQDAIDRKSGLNVGSTYVYDGTICDLTGERLTRDEVGYNIEADECIPREDEVMFAHKHNVDVVDFLYGSSYVFDERLTPTAMEQMLKLAKEDGMDRMFFDHLFRWARIKTADRLLSEGTYTKGELGMSDLDDEEE